MNNNFGTIKGRLQRAEQELLEAQKLANAKCCGTSIENIILELDKAIDEVNEHISKGIDEKELVK